MLMSLDLVLIGNITFSKNLFCCLKKKYYLCGMRNTLVLYFVYGILNLILLKVSIDCIIRSFVDLDYVGILLWTFILSVDLRDIITKHRNFTKYYPHFEDKWLYFL